MTVLQHPCTCRTRIVAPPAAQRVAESIRVYDTSPLVPALHKGGSSLIAVGVYTPIAMGLYPPQKLVPHTPRPNFLTTPAGAIRSPGLRSALMWIPAVPAPYLLKPPPALLYQNNGCRTKARIYLGLFDPAMFKHCNVPFAHIADRQ